MEVEAYRNLNRKGVWFSFRSKDTGLVCDRIDIKAGHRRTLRGCTFKVSKAGRARVLREQRKNVHALIVGEVDTKTYNPALNPTRLQAWKVKYDPYHNDGFIGVNEMGMTIKLKHAVYVTFDENGVTAWTV